MSADRLVLDPRNPEVNAYRLCNALVVPRPIAWISSVSADGVGNLAPHSFFTVASARPAIVQFTSVGTKDTLRNVMQTGEFVVNIATEPMTDLINASSAPYPPEVDEAVALGIRTEASDVVAVPRVADSPAAIECRLHSTVALGESTLVLGEVVSVAIRRDVLVGDHPELSLLRPMSRLGRDEWGLPPTLIHLTRPTSV